LPSVGRHGNGCWSVRKGHCAKECSGMQCTVCVVLPNGIHGKWVAM
jgi:hypothetical protein